VDDVAHLAAQAGSDTHSTMQPGDVYATYADIKSISHDYGFSPRTPLEQCMPRSVEWYLIMSPQTRRSIVTDAGRSIRLKALTAGRAR
jgi:nucleoside-diphosphate-sugar epimerase